jgi:TetR/AcrR family tetracycline transcriptional repressor
MSGMKIDQTQIVAQALVLLNREGLDGFNLRALAKLLNVQPPALYWHMESKAALFALMAAEVYGKALAAVPDELDWRQWLLCFGRSLRHALLAQRDGARLCAIAPPLRDGNRESALIAAPLAAGLSRNLALTYESSVISLALGWSIYEQNAALREYLAEMVDIEKSFETGLQAMVAGFPARDA